MAETWSVYESQVRAALHEAERSGEPGAFRRLRRRISRGDEFPYAATSQSSGPTGHRSLYVNPRLPSAWASTPLWCGILERCEGSPRNHTRWLSSEWFVLSDVMTRLIEIVCLGDREASQGLVTTFNHHIRDHPYLRDQWLLLDEAFRQRWLDLCDAIEHNGLRALDLGYELTCETVYELLPVLAYVVGPERSSVPQLSFEDDTDLLTEFQDLCMLTLFLLEGLRFSDTLSTLKSVAAQDDGHDLYAGNNHSYALPRHLLSPLSLQLLERWERVSSPKRRARQRLVFFRISKEETDRVLPPLRGHIRGLLGSMDREHLLGMIESSETTSPEREQLLRLYYVLGECGDGHGFSSMLAFFHESIRRRNQQASRRLRWLMNRVAPPREFEEE